MNQPLPLTVSEVIAAGPALALFLDIDGTLIELAETPDGVVVPDTLPPLLSRLSDQLGGAVALVSGRTLADIDRLFPGLSLAAAGVHGAEWRPANGPAHTLDMPPGLEDVYRDLLKFAEAHEGLHLEHKDYSLAFHYRQQPDLAVDVQAAVAAAVAGKSELVAMPGKMVVEIKPSDRDKGHAVAAFLETDDFAGRAPMFIGDDVTDESGFAAVNARDGVSVCVGTKADTVATHRLSSVIAVHDWLQDLSRALDGQQPAREQG